MPPLFRHWVAEAQVEVLVPPHPPPQQQQIIPISPRSRLRLRQLRVVEEEVAEEVAEGVAVGVAVGDNDGELCGL